MNQLKRTPLGYPTDCEGLEYLKMKDFMVCKYYSDKEVLSSNFIEQVLTGFKASIRWNTYINEIMTE